jgi:ketosteroid isomerase-like protein
MKIALGLAAAIAVAGLAIPPAQADDALEAQLKAVYTDQCTAIKAADFAGYEKTLSADFYDVDPAGKKETREQNIASMKTSLATAEVDACHVTFVSAERAGDTATASVVTSFDGTVQGSAPISVVTRETDMFVRSGDAWIQSSATAQEQTITVAGKIVQHLGAPASPAP